MNRKKYQYISFIFKALLIIIFISSPAKTEEKPFKIGMLLCLTGECAADGQGALDGAQMAADEINAAGGILGQQIKLISQDTSEAVSGAKAVSAYRALRLDPEIKFVIGPSWTPGGLALVPILSKDEVIITTPSVGVKEFHLAGSNIFNIRGTDEAASRKSAKFAIEKGWKSAVVFSSQQPWESTQGKSFADEFEKLGGKVLENIEPLPTITVLNTEAARAVRHKPDVIFFSNLVQMAIAAKDLQKLGWKGNKLAAYVDDTRLEESKGALEGTMFMTYQKPSENFVEKYSKRFKTKPEIPSGAGYDAIYAYSKAIAAAGSFDLPTVKLKMLDVKFDGVTGKIEFDKDGCVAKEPLLWRVDGKAFVRAES